MEIRTKQWRPPLFSPLLHSSPVLFRPLGKSTPPVVARRTTCWLRVGSSSAGASSKSLTPYDSFTTRLVVVKAYCWHYGA